MKTDQKIIDVDDIPREDDRPQERPVFSIERTKDSSAPNSLSPRTEEPIIIPDVKKGNTLKRAMTIIGFLCVALLIIGGLLWWRQVSDPRLQITSSVSDKENIHLLQQASLHSAAGTVHTADSVLGVAFDMYSLKGLRGSLERELPDTADRSLVLFMRSADYHPDGSLLGTVVIEGEKVAAKVRKNRTAYVALSAEGVPAIGISGSNRIADFLTREGGSMFRQYTLLGDGELPGSFDLHGKVERGAIARMADGEMYYVVTRNRETMYDFADAMREYGFTDAVYITGGNSYDFYRTADGTAHVSPRVSDKIEKYTSTPLPSPLLVFRTGNSPQ